MKDSLQRYQELATIFGLFFFGCGSPKVEVANTPEDVYRAYHGAMVAGDVKTFNSLNATSNKTRQVSEFQLRQVGQSLPKQVHIADTRVVGDRATLKITGIGGEVIMGKSVGENGTIFLVKENGQWKVESDDYSQ